MKAQDPRNPNPRWFALINDRIVTMPRPRVTGALIKKQASIPPANVLFRDCGSPDDVAIKDDETVDLAEGNVFYDREGCACSPKIACSAPAKMALCLDDRFELTAIATMTGADILELFDLPKHTKLFRDFEGPDDEIVEAGSKTHFNDGPCFLSKAKPHGPKNVTIKINGVDKEVAVGTYSVAELKKIGGVETGDELVQVIGNKPHRLPNDGSVQICGGEVFISHPCRGTSS
jgi:hypothetical protein